MSIIYIIILDLITVSGNDMQGILTQPLYYISCNCILIRIRPHGNDRIGIRLKHPAPQPLM